MKKTKQTNKIFEVTIQKILNKKFTMNAKDEEEARLKAEEFMQEVDIESLTPIETYSYEIEKISDNEEEYLKEKKLSKDFFQEDNLEEDEKNSIEDDKEKEYFVVIIIDDIKIFKAHGHSKFEAMSKMIDIAILNDLVTIYENNEGYVFINAEENLEDIISDYEEFRKGIKDNKSLNISKLDKQFKEEIERLSE